MISDWHAIDSTVIFQYQGQKTHIVVLIESVIIKNLLAV
jgi:hypothetical protein